MTEFKLETIGGRTAFEPTEALDLTASWALTFRPAAVEVRLVWYTRGKGDTDVEVVDTRRFEQPPAVAQERLRFLLPEGPYSFSGKLISLIWAAELVIWPSQDSCRLDLIIAPNGREVLLERAELSEPAEPPA